MVCKNCGANVPETSKFCTTCGATVETDIGLQDNAMAPAAEATGAAAILKDKQKLIKVGVPVLAGIVAVVIALILILGGSYKSVVKNYYKAMENGKGSTLQSCSPYEVAYLKATGKSKDYIKDQFNEAAKNRQQSLQEEYKKGYKVKYEIKDEEKMDKDDLDEYEDVINEAIKSEGIDLKKAKISAGYKLEVEVTIEGDEKDDTYTENLTVLKINGKWNVM